MTIIMDRQLYWDDVCYKKGHDDNDKPIKIFYSCYSAQAWDKHINTSKYKKMYKTITDDPNSIKCEHCKQMFCEEGYELHSARNKPLWDFQKIGMCMTMGCNRFKQNGRRYQSIDDMISKTAPDKPKQRRAKVGKISPITGMCRPPNKPNRTIEPSVSIDEPPSTSPDDLDCDEEPNLVLKIRNDDISEKDELLIDLYGTKLPFDHTCDSCYNPINYEYSSKLLNKLDIDVCNCDDTDTDSD